MNKITSIFWAISAFGIVAVMCISVTQSCVSNNNINFQRMKVCVQHGGSWVPVRNGDAASEGACIIK